MIGNRGRMETIASEAAKSARFYDCEKWKRALM
jgi:hypothetical protein